MLPMQCQYCGNAFGTTVPTANVGSICGGCGAPLPPIVTANLPFMSTPPIPFNPGSMNSPNFSPRILGFFVVIVLAIIMLIVVFAVSHPGFQSPMFGPTVTHTATGWEFRYSNGNVLTIGNPNLTASEAEDIAASAEQSTGQTRPAP